MAMWRALPPPNSKGSTPPTRLPAHLMQARLQINNKTALLVKFILQQQTCSHPCSTFETVIKKKALEATCTANKGKQVTKWVSITHTRVRRSLQQNNEAWFSVHQKVPAPPLCHMSINIPHLHKKNLVH